LLNTIRIKYDTIQSLFLRGTKVIYFLQKEKAVIRVHLKNPQNIAIQNKVNKIRNMKMKCMMK